MSADLDTLFALGRERGFVTLAELEQVMPAALDTDQIERYLQSLADAGIKVIDDARAADGEEDEPGVVSADEAAEIATYLREHTWPSLAREDELVLVKQIEARDLALLHAVAQSEVLLHQLFTMGEQLHRGTLEVEDIVRNSDEARAVYEHIEDARNAWADRSESGVDAARRDVYDSLLPLAFVDGLFEVDLGDVQRAATDAIGRLIDANQIQVASRAKKLTGRGVHFLVLLDAGNTGLRKALDRYEYKRGYKFSIYAQWWIRDAMLRRIAGNN